MTKSYNKSNKTFSGRQIKKPQNTIITPYDQGSNARNLFEITDKHHQEFNQLADTIMKGFGMNSSLTN